MEVEIAPHPPNEKIPFHTSMNRNIYAFMVSRLAAVY